MIGDVKPWGRAATLGLGLVALLTGQAVALMPLAWWYGVGLAHWTDFAVDGVAVTLIICISTPVQVLLLALLARRTGASAAEYLGFRLPHKSDVLRGIIAIVIFSVVGITISWLFDRHIGTQYLLDIYRTASAAGWLPWLWLTVVVVTPIGEETLFRGFLFRGQQGSFRDGWPVIIVTALLWALTHVQYDLYLIAQVFAYGVVLGWFRWVTGSTILAMLLHGLVNFGSMFNTFMAFHGLN
jgi:CAAX protease family protein